jgi:transcriptional regulator with XRE-family HTH domain
MGTSPTTLSVADAIKQEMERQGVSQLALSNATGIPRVTLIRRLNGDAFFTIAELAAIASHLGVRASDLIGDAA